MGIFVSKTNPNNGSDEKCFICSSEIKEREFVVCVRCNIKLHNECEVNTRQNKYYTQCPNCHRCGSLGCKTASPNSNK